MTRQQALSFALKQLQSADTLNARLHKAIAADVVAKYESTLEDGADYQERELAWYCEEAVDECF